MLSHYRIVEKVGEGGMGVVYRAVDVRLQRDVALKVLPPRVLDSPERRLRFLREARAAAAVSHPNIAAVYDVDEANGVIFIAMELVSGRTLRGLIGGRALPLKQVLSIGIQISDGLAKAHQARIIHRDLKPENVIVTTEGQAKILDFGLAKFLEESDSTEESAAGNTESGETHTITNAITRQGTLLGTVAYMSPEQASGHPLGVRSDLFSFGIVLYEMATGRVPFHGRNATETLRSIIHQSTPLASEINAKVPPELDRILGKCLEKEPNDRYQDSRDLVVDLRRLVRDSDLQGVRRIAVPGPLVWTHARWRRLALSLLFLSGAVVGLVSLRLGWFPLPRPPESRADLMQRPLTSNPPENALVDAAISSDGKYLAYVDQTGVFLRLVDGGETHALNLPPGFTVEDVEWFPDGDRLLLVRTPEGTGEPSSLWTVSVLGGKPRKILDDAYHPSVSPDGSRIAFVPDRRWTTKPSGIWLMGTDGQNVHSLVTDEKGGESDFDRPVWSPDGQKLAYGSTMGDKLVIRALDLRGGPQGTTIVSDPGLTAYGEMNPVVWTAEGRIVYVLNEAPPNESDANLWEVRVNPGSGRVSGEPDRLTNWSGFSFRRLSVTRDGKRLAFLKWRYQMDVYLSELRPGQDYLKKPPRLTLDDRDDWHVSWSRDGRSVLFDSNRYGFYEVFRQDINEGDAEAIIAGPENDGMPVVSPDGSFILYFTWPKMEAYSLNTPKRLMRVPASGGPTQAVPGCDQCGIVMCPSPSATRCIVLDGDKEAVVFSALDPLTGKGAHLLKLELSPINYCCMSLSPDGARLATVAYDQKRAFIRIFSLAGAAARDLDLKDLSAPQWLAWSPDGNDLFVTGWSPDRWALLLRLDREGHTGLLWRPPKKGDWVAQPEPSPDGHKIAFVVGTVEGNAGIIEGF